MMVSTVFAFRSASRWLLKYDNVTNIAHNTSAARQAGVPRRASTAEVATLPASSLTPMELPAHDVLDAPRPASRHGRNACPLLQRHLSDQRLHPDNAG